MKLDALLNPTNSSSHHQPSHHHHHRHQPSISSASASSFSRIDNHTRLPLPRHQSTSSHGSSPTHSPTYTAVPALDRSNSSDSGASASPISTPVQESYEYHSRFAPKHLAQLPPLPPKHNITLPPVRPHISHLRSSSTTAFGSRYFPPMAQTPTDQSFPPTPQSATSPDFGFPSAPLSAYGNVPTPLGPPTANSLFLAQQPQLMPQQQPLPPIGQNQNVYPQASAVGTASKSTKKNSYPCPVAKQYSCNEFFTTSGHAARHAKKHTGKKDAICPECGKAFTRKDNMEQHRRTHSGNRNNSKVAATKRESTEEAQARRQRQQQRKARPASISTSATASPLMAQSEMQMLDPALRGSPQDPLFPLVEDPIAQYINTNGMAMQSAPSIPAMMMRPDLQQAASAVQALHARQSSQGIAVGYPMAVDGAAAPSGAPALDALALAASRQNDGQ